MENLKPLIMSGDIVKDGYLHESFDLKPHLLPLYEELVILTFEEMNPTVEFDDMNVTSYNSLEAPALFGIWFKVITKEHGWLHVYFNRHNRKIEWF